MSDERVSRSAAFAFSAQMVGALLTAALTIFLGRRLSAAEYGSFTFALGVGAIAGLLADLGTTSSTGRYLAERRGRPAALGAVFRTATRLKLRISLVAAVALLVLAEPICHAFGEPAATWPLRALAIALLAQSMFTLLLGAFIAVGKLRYNLVIATAESVVEVLASVVLVLLGAGATGAAFGQASGYAVGLLVGLVMARRAFGGLRGARKDAHEVSPRQILRYARPLLAVEVAFRLFASIDVLLIAALVGGGAQIASFGLPMRLAAFLDYPAAAVASAVSPRLAHDEGEESNLRLFTMAMRYLVILQVLITAPFLIWSEAIVNLIFGSKYPQAPEVLQALTPYILLAGLAQITTLTVNYLGEARRRVPLAIAMLSVNVLIDVLLLPRIGIVAGAIGTSAAYAVWVPGHLWILRQHTGLRLRPLARTLARALIAGGAMVGVLALLGTGQVPIPLMLAGVVLGPLVYLAVLLAIREISPQELRGLRELLARRVAA
jgi:O-antigen/teichoic acid export membrane protein